MTADPLLLECLEFHRRSSLGSSFAELPLVAKTAFHLGRICETQ
jgi:hypothetical protein